MIVDKTGRKIKIGQIVDVFLLGPYQAKVVDIKEQAIILSPQQQIRPHVVLSIPVTPYILQDGSVQDIYIVQEPNPKDPVVIEAESKGKNGSIVSPS